MPRSASVYIGLGSNVGDRVRNLDHALTLLARQPGIRIEKISPLYLTAPVGPKQRDFVNAAARVRARMAPEKLLSTLKSIEQKMGRVKTRRWGPRVIDLDILLFSGSRVTTRYLSIPHPRMHERLFVLKPLADIAPRVIHPRLHKTAAALLKEAVLTYPEQKVKIYSRLFKK